MTFLIDHRQVTNWAKSVKASPQRLDTEMVRELERWRAGVPSTR